MLLETTPSLGEGKPGCEKFLLLSDHHGLFLYPNLWNASCLFQDHERFSAGEILPLPDFPHGRFNWPHFIILPHSFTTEWVISFFARAPQLNILIWSNQQSISAIKAQSIQSRAIDKHHSIDKKRSQPPSQCEKAQSPVQNNTERMATAYADRLDGRPSDGNNPLLLFIKLLFLGVELSKI